MHDLPVVAHVSEHQGFQLGKQCRIYFRLRLVAVSHIQRNCAEYDAES